MTYAQLKAFHAVAEERSFQRAAQRLYLTQPAVSIQIRNLERDSGRTLFRRGGHRVELTEEGRALLRATARMFEAEREARGLLSDSETALAPILHLGADGPHVALDLIAAFGEVAPEVRLRVTLANAEETWDNLLSLRVDIAVMANAPGHRNVICQVISRQDLMAYLPAGHALATRDGMTFEELAEAPLIFREAGSNTQQIVDRAFAERDIRIDPHLVLGSREAVCEAVARGLGIGFLFGREGRRDPACRALPIRGYEACNRDMLLCLKDQRTAPLVARFLALAQSLAV